MDFPQCSKLSSVEALFVCWSILLLFGSARAAGSYCQEQIGDSGVCSACPVGYWGERCQNTCDFDHCMLNTCDIDTSYCTYGCADGYYFDDSDKICKLCPARCAKCISPTNCTECFDGYKGLQCQDKCDNLCAKCSRFECFECDKGLYGRACMYNCSFCGGGCDRLNCIGGCLSDQWHMFRGAYCVLCTTSWCKTCSVWDACETCVDGRWGSSCESLCPENCHGGICNKTTGECVCKDKYYMDSNLMCQECPNDCATCSSAEDCPTCVDGFYGSQCEHRCTSTCLTCSGQASTCTDCRKLYTLRNNRCHPCPEGCRSCYYSSHRGHGRCWDGACIEGYYFSKGGDYNFAKEDDICRKCPTGCSSCMSGSICRSCQSGYFPFLSICCPKHCTTCISGTECKTCPRGMYGKLCERQCSEGCLSCSNGDYCNVCTNGRYSKSSEYKDNQCECSSSECLSSDQDGKCLTCKRLGWYPHGKGCCPCSEYCQSGTCDSEGRCSACSTDTKYGQSCEHDCSTGIPFCKRCTDTSRLACIECESGSYLLNGACIKCFSQCVDSECDHRNGHCVHGCVDGWTDMRCEKKCNDNCHRCDRSTSVCAACKGGNGLYGRYYGEYCESACSRNCDSGKCNITGECQGMCTKGYWGKTCATSCGNGCIGACSQVDGTCELCIRELYGSHCYSSCNDNCVDPKNGTRTCRQVDGECIFGCVAGYEGHRCAYPSFGLVEPTSNVALIVGIAVGVLVVTAVIIFVVVYICRKRGSRDDAYLSHGAGTSGKRTSGPVDSSPHSEQVIPLTTTMTTKVA